MEQDKNKPTNLYTADSIGQEEGAEAHRKSAARHMGANDTEGIFNQLIEIVDNSIDEVKEYYSNPNLDKDNNPIINVIINEDDSVVVEDFGRGIPCENNSKTGIPAIITVAESDSAGGKGRGTQGYATKTSGVHGAGMAIAKSLADYFIFEVASYSAKGRYRLEYRKGHRVGELQHLGPLDKNNKGEYITGTKITYKYDPSVLKPTRNGITVKDVFRENEIYNRITNSIIGEKVKFTINYKYKNKPVRVITPDTMSPQVYLQDKDLAVIQIDGSKCNNPYDIDIYISLDLGRTIGKTTTIVNRLVTTSSPTDRLIMEEIQNVLEGMLASDTTVPKEISDNGLPIDILSRKLSVLTIMGLEKTAFAGQNKSILKSNEYVSHLRGSLQTILPKNQDFIDKIYKPSRKLARDNYEFDKAKKKIEEKRAKEREKMKDVKEKVNQLDKLRNDLSYRNEIQEKSPITLKPSPMRPKDSAIVYVEGNSAGAELNDLHLEGDQPIAIAMTDGNPPNVYEEKVMSDFTRDNIAFCLEGGYKYIAIMTDADPDGEHIRTLWAYHIWKYAPTYLKEGRVFIVPVPYGEIMVTKPCMINLYGEIKTYPVGKHTTYSGKEHATLEALGANSLRKYKGMADTPNPLAILKDKSKWIPIQKVIPEDIKLLELLLESASSFKKQFTSQAYSDRQFVSYKIQRMKDQIEIPLKTMETIYKPGALTKQPSLDHYMDTIHPNVIEKYTNKHKM